MFLLHAIQYNIEWYTTGDNMTINEAIKVLEIEYQKCKGDFYNDRRRAIELAIKIMKDSEEKELYDKSMWC